MGPLGVLLFHSLFFGAMAIAHAFRSNQGACFDEGTLTVERGELRLDGRELARTDELTQGFTVPSQVGLLVRIERRLPLPPLVFRVRDEEQARTLLGALGFDAARTAAELTMASEVLAMPIWKQLPLLLAGPIAGAVLAGVLGPSLGPLVLAMILVWVLGLSFAPTTVRVGTDGLMTRWLGRERFVLFPGSRAWSATTRPSAPSGGAGSASSSATAK